MRQNLASIQPKLDDALRIYFQGDYEEVFARQHRLGTASSYRDNLSLNNVRHFIDNFLKRAASGGSSDKRQAFDVKRFSETLEAAKSLIDSWGGALSLSTCQQGNVICPELSHCVGCGLATPSWVPSPLSVSLSLISCPCSTTIQIPCGFS